MLPLSFERVMPVGGPRRLHLFVKPVGETGSRTRSESACPSRASGRTEVPPHPALSLRGRGKLKVQNRFSCLAFCRRLFGSFLGLPFFFGSRRTGSSSSASCFLANGRAPDICNRVSKSPDVITMLPWA